MRALGPVALAALLLPASACLPNRDNDNDPSLLPVPVLEFSSGPNDHVNGCGAPDSLLPSFTRARCLHIDFSNSSDPQDDISSGVLTLSTGGTFSANPADQGVVLASGLTLAMPVIDVKASTLPPTLQPGPHQLRLTLLDARGHSAFTSLGVTLVNNLPIAIAPSPRQLPFYGAVWTGTAGPLVTHLDGGASVDPDGDRPLYYRWTIQSGQVFVPQPPPAVFTTDAGLALMVVPNGTTGSVVMQLDVSDGTVDPATGEKKFTSAFTQVNLDEPTKWGFEDDTGDLIQLDLDRAVYPTASIGNLQSPRGRPAIEYAYTTIGATPHVIPDQSALYFVADPSGNGSNYQLQKRMFSSTNATLSGVVMPEQPIAVILSPETIPPTPRTVWVATGAVDSTLHLYAYDASLALIDELDTGLPIAGTDPPDSTFDPVSGELWLAANLATTAHPYSLVGNAIVAGSRSISLDADHFITGMSSRKNAAGEGEIWVVSSVNVLQGASPGAVAQLFVLREGETVPVEAALLDGTGVALGLPTAIIGFDFTGLGDAWLGLAGVGVLSMHVVDSATNPPSLVLRTIASTGDLGFDFAVNHQSGTLLEVSSGHHRIERFGLNGTFTKSDTATRIDDILGFDTDGKVWMAASDDVSGGSVVVRGLGAGVEGIVARFSAPLGLGNSAADYATGDAWIPSIFPSGIQREYTDGRSADFVHGMASADFTQRIEIPPPSLLTIDPATGWVWTFAGGDPGGSSGSTRGFVLSPYVARQDEDYAVSPYAPLGPVIAFDPQLTTEQILGAAALADVPDHGAVLLIRKSVAAAGSCSNGTGAAYSFALHRVGSDGADGGTSTPFAKLCESAVPRTDSVQIARDLQTNEICVAVVDSANGVTLRSRRYTPGLVLIPAFTQDVPIGANGGELTSVAASKNACFMGYLGSSQQGQIEAVIKTGSGALKIATSAPVSAQMTVLAPTITREQIYNGALVTEIWGGGTKGPIQKFVLTTSGTATLLRDGNDQLAVPFRTRLLQR